MDNQPRLFVAVRNVNTNATVITFFTVISLFMTCVYVSLAYAAVESRRMYARLSFSYRMLCAKLFYMYSFN